MSLGRNPDRSTGRTDMTACRWGDKAVGTRVWEESLWASALRSLGWGGACLLCAHLLGWWVHFVSRGSWPHPGYSEPLAWVPAIPSAFAQLVSIPTVIAWALWENPPSRPWHSLAAIGGGSAGAAACAAAFYAIDLPWFAAEVCAWLTWAAVGWLVVPGVSKLHRVVQHRECPGWCVAGYAIGCGSAAIYLGNALLKTSSLTGRPVDAGIGLVAFAPLVVSSVIGCYCVIALLQFADGRKKRGRSAQAS